MVEALKLPYPIWLDPQDIASRRFGVNTLPSTLLLTPKGERLWTKQIDANDPTLLEALNQALEDRAGNRSVPCATEGLHMPPWTQTRALAPALLLADRA